MENQITIEQLAEKIGGNLWVKGDMKRIYLDRGHNTKKMSTKTFIFQDENGDFKVSCRVDCPSQPWQWCKSQEEEVKEGVYEDIEDAISDTVYILTNKEGVIVGWDGKPRELNCCENFLTEGAARAEIDNCVAYEKFITMPRDEFEAEVDRIDEIEREKRSGQ